MCIRIAARLTGVPVIAGSLCLAETVWLVCLADAGFWFWSFPARLVCLAAMGDCRPEPKAGAPSSRRLSHSGTRTAA